MPHFEIDADIKSARTLPSSFYTESRWYELSLERIFGRSWQFVRRADEVANLFPEVLFPGSLEEPVVLSRSGDDISCLSNVCTHRGKILVEAPCRADGIRCRYHGRRFGLDGRFASMPEFEGVVNFPGPEDDLVSLPCDYWNGFVFASPAPHAPLTELFEGVGNIVNGFDFAGLRFEGERTYGVDAHWALYCENYLEGFHIPYVHPELNKVLDYASYSTTVFRFASLQKARSDGAEGEGKPPFADGIEALYLFLFPNTMLNFYPWGVSVNIVLPKSPDRTDVRYLTYVCDSGKKDSGAGADLDSVEMEDQAVVESVQRGIRSRYYDRGRYSPTRETGTHHFHRLISEFLGD